MSVVVGIVGTLIAVGLCVQMLVDVARSRTVLTPHEELLLKLERRPLTPIEQFAVDFEVAILGPITEAFNQFAAGYVEAFRPVVEWARSMGLVE